MTLGEAQETRLMGLLQKLTDRDDGGAMPSMSEMIRTVSQFNGQEHNDAKTLVHLGWIKSKHFFNNVDSSWSGEGIYAFDLTEDGREALANWQARRMEQDATSGVGEGSQQTRRFVMTIHGSKDGQVPGVVERIRMWCFEQGLDAFKAADIPNAGRFVNQKVNDVADSADYYIVILTADEELKNGGFRPRPNALMEMALVLNRAPERVCVLVEDGVEMPSDYAGLVTEPLNRWKEVLPRELRNAGLL